MGNSRRGRGEVHERGEVEAAADEDGATVDPDAAELQDESAAPGD